LLTQGVLFNPDRKPNALALKPFKPVASNKFTTRQQLDNPILSKPVNKSLNQGNSFPRIGISLPVRQNSANGCRNTLVRHARHQDIDVALPLYALWVHCQSIQKTGQRHHKPRNHIKIDAERPAQKPLDAPVLRVR